MARTAKKAAAKKSHHDDSLYAEDLFDMADANLDELELRESEGCMDLGSGSFLRMRPPGAGPDFESASLD